MPKQNEDQYSADETERRRDAVVKRMLTMPPKPHSEMKVGKLEKSSIPKRNIKK